MLTIPKKGHIKLAESKQLPASGNTDLEDVNKNTRKNLKNLVKHLGNNDSLETKQLIASC